MDKTYDNPVLRLWRPGGSTTIVTVDGDTEYLVTAEMLGSWDFMPKGGSYDLELGALSEGSHSIAFTVADDGKGNGVYSWQAIVLYKAPPT